MSLHATVLVPLYVSLCLPASSTSTGRQKGRLKKQKWVAPATSVALLHAAISPVLPGGRKGTASRAKQEETVEQHNQSQAADNKQQHTHIHIHIHTHTKERHQCCKTYSGTRKCILKKKRCIRSRWWLPLPSINLLLLLVAHWPVCCWWDYAWREQKNLCGCWRVLSKSGNATPVCVEELWWRCNRSRRGTSCHHSKHARHCSFNQGWNNHHQLEG